MESKCPKCGSPIREEFVGITGFHCGTATWTDGSGPRLKESDACTIAQLRQQLAECQRQLKGYQQHMRDCEQIAGKALGYPWFKDDQENFPDSTEADGVCIGEHIADTIVEELAKQLAAVTAERDRLWEERNEYRDLYKKAKAPQ